MVSVVFWLVVLGAVKLMRRKRQRKPASKPLCTGCAFAHVQWAMNGGRAISCTFGGGVRPIAMDVLYCTDYCSRDTPRRVVTIGFAVDPQPVTELAEVANA